MPDKITKKVKDFYEQYPYPNQRVCENKSLINTRQKDVMKNILSTVELSILELDGLCVLDAGCGTGEKALFCKMHGADVDAFDLSNTSIRIAKENSERMKIDVNYFQGDFAEVRLEKKYDLILAIGTLHHSSDPMGNFEILVKHLKKNGRIALGLYNLYGRLGCRVHRKILGSGKKNTNEILKKVGVEKINNKTKAANLADRFGSPHESYHDIEEVLKWFEKSDIVPCATYPRVELKSRLKIKIKQIEWLAKSRGFFFIGGKLKP